MNNDQLWAWFRTVLTAIGASLGTWLVAKGYLSSDQLASLGGFLHQLLTACIAFAPVALSLYGSWRANTAKSKLSSVAAMPEVAKVELHSNAQPLADSVPSTKVETK